MIFSMFIFVDPYLYVLTRASSNHAILFEGNFYDMLHSLRTRNARLKRVQRVLYEL